MAPMVSYKEMNNFILPVKNAFNINMEVSDNYDGIKFTHINTGKNETLSIQEFLSYFGLSNLSRNIYVAMLLYMERLVDGA